MSKFNAGKASVLVLTAVFAFVLFLFSGQSVMAVVNLTPSTNNINRTKGWAHVDATSGVGEAVFNFIQPRSFFACFEYRTDGDTSQVIREDHWLERYGVVPPGDLQQYPYYCLSTISSQTETIQANGYVEVRMMFGAEGDERFDWTRFEVEPTPDVCDNLDGDQATVPPNMETNSDNNCSCLSGYHEVNSDGQDVAVDHLDSFTCEADPAPVPTPETCVGDQHLDATGLKCVSFTPAGPPVRNDEGTGGQVLGASTGKVLGASTLAGTGSFAENLYLAIMTIGGLITAAGAINFKKTFKAVK